MPSSVIAAIHYDPDTSTLRIIYVSGSIYDYKNVPEDHCLKNFTLERRVFESTY